VSKEKARGAIGRREFLAGAAAAATLTILRPGSARGAEANAKMELGLIGCGGRGQWVADLFEKNTPTKCVAVHDYFADRANQAGTRFQTDEKRRDSGLSGYKRLLEGKLDAVAIESPPYFHPEQAAAAIDAGKHVYVAKPTAVDVPGCMTIAAAGKKATEKKLAFLVDFQSRANTFFREAVKWVHDGNIGKIGLIQANYFTGAMGRRAPGDTGEARVVNWVFDIALSGDIIVEQNIHALDIATWFANADPIKACGTGGRTIRTDVGDCWDHFAVVFWCPNDLIIDFSSTQCTEGYGGILCKVLGATGSAITEYGGQVTVRGRKSYKGGNTGPIYQDGAVTNMKDFHKSIAEGNFANETVAPSVRSNLTCVLGREAAYKGAMVTWDEMVKANVKMDGKLEGLRD
jgi:predicted dehydrogenase